MKLFMQAKELMNIRASDAPDWDSLDNKGHVYSRKLSESKETPLYDSIKEEGIKKPVTLTAMHNDDETGWDEVIEDGHHRSVAAHDINPEMYVPVQYSHRFYYGDVG